MKLKVFLFILALPGIVNVSAAQSSGVITTIAGNSDPFGSILADGKKATSGNIGTVQQIAVSKAGVVYFTSSGSVRSISPTGILGTVAGKEPAFGADPKNGSTANKVFLSGDLSIDLQDALVVSDGVQVFRVSDGKLTLLAGNGAGSGLNARNPFEKVNTSDGIPAKSATLLGVNGMAIDSKGNIFLSETAANRIRKVSLTGTISTIAGILNSSGSSGDGGSATKAKLDQPSQITLDALGNLYFLELGTGSIRKISSTGIISTVARNAYFPLISDPKGVLYFSQINCGCIKKLQNGEVSTFAGEAPSFDNNYGDGGPASKALLSNPFGLAFDAQGNLLISDNGNNRIRKVSGVASFAPKGDVNEDGKANVQDAITILKASIGQGSLNENQKASGDMNSDGKVNVQDAIAVLRKAIGL